VKKIIESKDVDCLLFSDISNIYYISHFKGFEGVLLIIPKDGTSELYVPKLEYERALEESENVNINVYSESLEQAIKDFIGKLKCKKIGLPYFKTSLWLANKLSKISQEIKLEDISKEIMEVRAIKDIDEVEAIKKAVKITEKGFDEALNILSEGVRELDVAAKIEYTFKVNGSYEVAFPCIVASGRNSALPHATASEKTIRRGEIVVVDIGAKYMGYCGDLTRTISLGSVSSKLKDIFYAVLEAQKEAIRKIKPGIKASEVDAAARNVLKEYGYDKFFTHSTGHGIGIEVHEYPRLSNKSNATLKTGMVVTVEPGVYIRDLGGIRIEDDVLVTDSGYVILSTYPKDLIE